MKHRVSKEDRKISGIDDPKLKAFLKLYPMRVESIKVERDTRGNAILIYPKNFTRFERWLHRYIGGPEEIRRPLDDMGTAIWDLCDGRHSVGDIVLIMHERFRERIEPAGTRVAMFLDRLHSLGLITFRQGAIEDDDTE